MLTFLDKVKIYEDDLNRHGIYRLNRSQVFELIKQFRKVMVQGEKGLGWVEFVRSRINEPKNLYYNLD